MLRHQPRSTLFPYPTLFRSRGRRYAGAPLRARSDRRRRVRSWPTSCPHPWSDTSRRRARDCPGSATPPCRRRRDRKSTRLNSSHVSISYAVFCLKKKKKNNKTNTQKNNHTKLETLYNITKSNTTHHDPNSEISTDNPPTNITTTSYHTSQTLCHS